MVSGLNFDHRILNSRKHNIVLPSIMENVTELTKEIRLDYVEIGDIN
jgi:hypothetical protein